MRELRSVVNAVFLFLFFLLVWAFIVPGHARGSSHRPRFLRMQVVDLEGHHGRGPDRINFTIPYGFFSGALRFASMGRVRRELDLHFTDSVEARELREIWAELKSKPEGTEVVRDKEREKQVFKREGSMVVLDVAHDRHDGQEVERVTIRVPARLFETFVSDDRDLDVDSLIAELRKATPGDLVEVQAKDAHVRIWVE